MLGLLSSNPHNAGQNRRISEYFHCKHTRLFTQPFIQAQIKTSKLRVTGLCEGNSPVTGEFPAQKDSNAKKISIRWRHHNLWALPYRYQECRLSSSRDQLYNTMLPITRLVSRDNKGQTLDSGKAPVAYFTMKVSPSLAKPPFQWRFSLTWVNFLPTVMGMWKILTVV